MSEVWVRLGLRWYGRLRRGLRRIDVERPVATSCDGYSYSVPPREEPQRAGINGCPFSVLLSAGKAPGLVSVPVSEWRDNSLNSY